ncbi:MAG: isocitrate lyase/phosphoenolpyruvate mutase family protein [Vicinamibacterales bacterium]
MTVISAEHQRKAEHFLALHSGPLLVLPTAWDVLSAKVFEEQGCHAVATTSAGVSWSLGFADGERIPWPAMLGAIERIARAVRVPINADIETGFSNTLPELAGRIDDLMAVGTCGVNLEDGLDHGARLRTIDDMCSRIATVRQAASRAGCSLVITARADVHLRAGNDPARLDDTIARCRAYAEAGANCVFPIGLSDLGMISKLVAEAGVPVNVHGRRGCPSLAHLEAAGVARVSTAVTAAVFVAGALEDAMKTLARTRSFDHFTSTFDYARMQGLFPR